MVDIRKMVFKMMANAQHLHIISLINSFRFLKTLINHIFEKEICAMLIDYAMQWIRILAFFQRKKCCLAAHNSVMPHCFNASYGEFSTCWYSLASI